MMRSLLLLVAVTSLLAAESSAPLAAAAKRMDRSAVAALLKKGAAVNAPQVDGATPLHWAAYNDDLETAALLVRAGANVKAANRYAVTPLSLACTNGSAAMIALLLDAGADPNASLPGGETALLTASRTGKADAVKLLLARGAVVDAKEEKHGQTALVWAAAEGNAEAVETLIAAGADFRLRLRSGLTPLLIAVREGHLPVVKVLLKAGADVNETVHPGPTEVRKSFVYATQAAPRAATGALGLAVLNGHFELASALLDAGADPNANGPGWTALHALSWVRKAGAGDNDPAPQGSGSMSSLELAKKLVAKGARINATMPRRVNAGLTRLNTLGATPFLLACRTADIELMRALLALGADPLLPNAEKSTPLMAAAGLGTRSPGEDAGTEPEVLEAVKLAIELGNDPNAVDDNGETAMHGAAYKNLPQVVEFLYEHGARIDVWNRKNKFGWTPLWIADGHRFGNFKPSPDTIAAFHKIMTKEGASLAGISSSGENVDYRKR